MRRYTFTALLWPIRWHRAWAWGGRRDTCARSPEGWWEPEGWGNDAYVPHGVSGWLSEVGVMGLILKQNSPRCQPSLPERSFHLPLFTGWSPCAGIQCREGPGFLPPQPAVCVQALGPRRLPCSLGKCPIQSQQPRLLRFFSFYQRNFHI